MGKSYRGETLLRQQMILQRLANGIDLADIVSEMYISLRTAKYDLHMYCQENGLNGRCHAVAHALREGFIE